MANKSHWQPKEQKVYFVQDVQEWLSSVLGEELSLPSLYRLSRRDLDLLASAANRQMVNDSVTRDELRKAHSTRRQPDAQLSE